MWKQRILSGLAIAALGLVGARGALWIDSRDAASDCPSGALAVAASPGDCYSPETGTGPAPQQNARDSRAGSASASGNAALGRVLRGSLDMICLSNRHLEGGPFAAPEVYRSLEHHAVEKLTWSSPSVTTWERGRTASGIETSSR